MFDIESLTRMRMARSRSISAENIYGKPGCGGMQSISPGAPLLDDIVKSGQHPSLPSPHYARDLGDGFKSRPCLYLKARSVTTIMDVAGPGVIRHIWMTTNGNDMRSLILRMYWDGEDSPSVETPLGDFFCCAQGYYAEFQSQPFCVNSANAYNAYVPMPFAGHAKITIENIANEDLTSFFYTIDYTLEELPAEVMYFHSSFRRADPLGRGESMPIVENVSGSGVFFGCYLAWQQNSNGWWGEGEVRMFLDDDDEYPTICGTGTEDYFCGAWGFRSGTFASPFAGYPCGGAFKAGMRHGLYRFHIPDPVYFQKQLKVTVQAIGWRSEGRFRALQDDISATAYWYQKEPHAPLPPLPSPPLQK